VLCVDGDPRPDEDFLSESFYLRFALSPGVSALSPIAVKTVGPDEFAGEDLAAYDLVVLANLERVEPTRARDLAAAVKGGRGLAIFLGELCDADAYNRTLFGGPDALLPARLGPAMAGAGETGGWSLGKAGFSGPVMTFFKSAGGLDAVRASRARELDLTGAGQAAVDARLVPGNVPFLVTAQVGEGRLAVINSTADAQWSNLPLKPAFTALVQRLAVWLLEPRSRCQNLQAGETYRLGLPLTAVKTTVSVRLPDKRTVGLSPNVAGERAVVEFGDTARTGFYEVTWNAEAGPERRLFAVNTDPAESDLTTIEPGALRELAAGAPVGWTDAADPGAQADLFRKGGREFWRAVFIAMLLVLGAETLLGRRFSGAGSGKKGSGVFSAQHPAGPFREKTPDPFSPGRWFSPKWAQTGARYSGSRRTTVPAPTPPLSSRRMPSPARSG